MHPATLDRYIRELRAAGLIRTGKRGGGRDAVHYTPFELVLIVLATTATGPGGAVEAARNLASLRAERESWPTIWDILEKHFQVSTLNLAEFLSRLVERYGQGNSEAGYLDMAVSTREELTACLDPLVAWTSKAADDKNGQGDQYRFYWRPSQEALDVEANSLSRGRRVQVSFSFEVLRTLGELIGTNSDEQDLIPESENAAPARAAPTQTDQSSNTHPTGTLLNSRDNRVRVCVGQPLPALRLVAPSSIMGVRELATRSRPYGAETSPRLSSR